jgi:hypothetical protein
LKVPDSVGVPEIVMTLATQVAVIPEGKPVTVPILVAPVVACVILGSKLFQHNVGVEDAPLAEL